MISSEEGTVVLNSEPSTSNKRKAKSNPHLTQLKKCYKQMKDTRDRANAMIDIAVSVVNRMFPDIDTSAAVVSEVYSSDSSSDTDTIVE